MRVCSVKPSIQVLIDQLDSGRINGCKHGVRGGQCHQCLAPCVSQCWWFIVSLQNSLTLWLPKSMGIIHWGFKLFCKLMEITWTAWWVQARDICMKFSQSSMQGRRKLCPVIFKTSSDIHFYSFPKKTIRINLKWWDVLPLVLKLNF